MSEKIEKALELIQQGDVLCYRLEAMPAGLKKKEPTNGLYTVALGEVTGHHHSAVADEKLEFYEDENGTLFLNVVSDEGATLTHQTHGPVKLPKGCHQIGITVEHDPFEAAVRKVRD